MLDNIKIGTKLIISFTILFIIIVAIGTTGIIYIDKITYEAGRMYQLNTEPLGAMIDIAVKYQRTRVNIRQVILTKDSQYIDRLKELDKEMEKHLSFVEGTLASEQTKAAFAEIKKSM